MSYILVTFGYNQFNLFNIKASVPTLIDKIKEVAFQNIVQKSVDRDKQLNKEIENLNTENERIKKQIAATEQELQIEKEKYDLAVKQLEAKKKKEELEQKKREEEEKKSSNSKQKKVEKKVNKKGKSDSKRAMENEGISDQPIIDLKEKIEKLNNSLNTTINNKNIYINKKSKLQEIINQYKEKYKKRMNIKIDLSDSKGEKVNINNKGDIYANEILIEKTCYELFSFNEVIVEEEKDTKKSAKKDLKKEDKKGEEKKDEKEMKDKEKENKDGKIEQKIEYVLEPVKIDGYCFRSVQEDEEMGDNDKGAKDKKTAKKK